MKFFVLLALVCLTACDGQASGDGDSYTDTDTACTGEACLAPMDTDTDTDTVCTGEACLAPTDTDSGTDTTDLPWGCVNQGTAVLYDVSEVVAQVTAIDAGYDSCADDESIHRRATVSCYSATNGHDDSDWAAGCDAPCTGDQRCVQMNAWRFQCITPCQADSDCGATEICLCAFSAGFTSNYFQRCVPADCRSDEDCAPYQCGLNYDDEGEIQSLECHTPADECRGHLDCGDDMGGDVWEGTRCGWDATEEHWVCGDWYPGE